MEKTQKTPKDYGYKSLLIPGTAHAALVQYYGKGRMAGAVVDMIKKATCQHPRDQRIPLHINASEYDNLVPCVGFWCKDCETVVSNLKENL